MQSQPILTPEQETLRQRFLSLQTPRDVAALLGIEYSNLTYYIYRSDPVQRYREFVIPKKSGGARRILAPSLPLKLLQQKLNKALQAAYRPKPSARGFVKGASVLGNALPHLRMAYVLNLDLEDFFVSINFGRVRGMFMGKPYSLNSKVATILAQICCHDNHLPQGAPTSPIVANMVCAKLDSELQRLARKYRCYYTRYADDITFSTDRQSFPGALAVRDGEGYSADTSVGAELARVIRSNGFSVNRSKVRLQWRGRRQQVTGVLVNKKPNVPRAFVRNVRGMLHAWEKWGLGQAESEFYARYDTKHRNPLLERAPFKSIVHGKLNYIKMIRGPSDPVYLKLRARFGRLDPRYKGEVHKSPHDQILDALWILESEEAMVQGTAFMLSGYGMVTCSHVVAPGMVAFRPREHYLKIPVKVVRQSKDLDIALLSIDAESVGNLDADMESEPRMRQEVVLAGFPNYRMGDTGHVVDGKIASFRMVSGVQRFLITAPIIAGNSGGPVLSQDNKVIGIAVTGADEWNKAPNTEDHGVIPITALRLLQGEESL